jgi:hypothetical protein
MVSIKQAGVSPEKFASPGISRETQKGHFVCFEFVV